MSGFNKLIKGEEILVRLKTKRDIGFWQYQILGILSLFMEKGNDYFIITDKRILMCIKENITANFLYKDFSKIKFNTKTDLLSFVNENNQIKEISLSELKLEYDDYQFLKNKLN